MKKYKVTLEGKNFIINSDEVPTKMGFYTTRFVEADNPEDAERLSVELIRNDSTLQNVVLNEESDPPMIYIESIDELSSVGDVNLSGEGYSFYQEDSDS